MSLHYGYRSGETGSSRNEKYSAAYSGYFGSWTDSSLIAVRYKDTSTLARKLCLIMTNDAWSSYAKYEQLDDANSVYGGPRSSKTHWFVRGYWGDNYTINMSTGALTDTGSLTPPYTGFVWDVNTDYVLSQRWDLNIARATHTSAISNSPSWTDVENTKGYMHGINVLGNGTIVACKGYASNFQTAGTKAYVSTNGGLNWSVAYVSPGRYSFGGYSISFPGWTGASTTNGALFWYVGIDTDGAGSGTTLRDEVLYTEDGSNWSNLGIQSNGMGAPTYHSSFGNDRLINVPGTNRIWTIKNGSTLWMSTNGYQFSSVNTNGSGIENIVYDNSKYFYGAAINGTGIDIYKTSDVESQITSTTTWNKVGNTIDIVDAGGIDSGQMSLYAPWPN